MWLGGGKCRLRQGGETNGSSGRAQAEAGDRRHRDRRRLCWRRRCVNRRSCSLDPVAGRQPDGPAGTRGRARRDDRRGLPGHRRPPERDGQGAVHRPGRLPSGEQHRQLRPQRILAAAGGHERRPEQAAGQGRVPEPVARISLAAPRPQVRPDPVSGRQGVHALPGERRLRVRDLLGRRSAHDVSVAERGLSRAPGSERSLPRHL